MVAKIATEVGKKSATRKNESPFGFTIVSHGKEAEFLSPLSADMLWGVGPKTFARLTELGIHTIGDIANWPQIELINELRKSKYKKLLEQGFEYTHYKGDNLGINAGIHINELTSIVKGGIGKQKSEFWQIKIPPTKNR